MIDFEAENKRLSELNVSLQVENVRLRGEYVGCSDGGCLLKEPGRVKGMCTNGGCHCLHSACEDMCFISRVEVMHVLRGLRARIRELEEDYKAVAGG